MEVNENEKTFLDDSENTADNDDDESKTQPEVIEEEAVAEGKTENNLGLLSNSLVLCKDN